MNPVAREAQARAQRDADYYERMGCKVLMSEGIALQLGVTLNHRFAASVRQEVRRRDIRAVSKSKHSAKIYGITGWSQR